MAGGRSGAASFVVHAGLPMAVAVPGTTHAFWNSQPQLGSVPLAPHSQSPVHTSSMTTPGRCTSVPLGIGMPVVQPWLHLAVLVSRMMHVAWYSQPQSAAAGSVLDGMAPGAQSGTQSSTPSPPESTTMPGSPLRLIGGRGWPVVQAWLRVAVALLGKTH